MSKHHPNRRSWNFIDLTGQRFGRLLVLNASVPAKSSTRWECRCDCGAIAIIATGNLRHGHTRSCGCLKRDGTGHITHGLSKTRELRIWQKMIARCHRPEDDHFKYYGARGIYVCDRWRNSVADFYSDMGPRPSPKHSIERKNNDGPYSPDNCRWATHAEQMLNRRNSVMLTYLGKTQNLCLWAKELGLPFKLLQSRNARGWPTEKILETPRKHYWSRRITRKS